MTEYELDAIPGNDDEASGESTAEEALGVPVPEEHVGAFVAEVFEDAERATTWAEVVDAMVAPDARDAWEELAPAVQVREVLEAAADYDRRAIEALEEVPLEPAAQVGDRIGEAKRCRANADTFRDGVAAAFADGHVDEDGLVAALEEAAFDTEAVARREELLEDVASVHDVTFRPYGGTLVEDGDRETADPTAGETW